MIGLEDVKLKKEKNMNNKIVDAITTGFDMLASKFKKEQEEVSFGSINSKDGSVSIEFDGDSIQIGSDVWVMDQDGQKVPLPVGSYELEDGSILVVNETGKVGEVKEAVSAPMSSATDEAKQAEEISTAVENAIKSIMIKYSKEIAVYAEKVDKLEKNITAFMAEPSAKPISFADVKTNETKEKKGRFDDLLNNL